MTISARTVNAVLSTVRDISGPQYDHLLERSGWTRFRATLPADTADLVATRAELESLFTNVYALLGEELMRLFLRNYGRLLATHLPSGPALRQTAATLAPERRLAWFIEQITQISTKYWTPTTSTEDSAAYYLSFARCPLCAGIHGAQAALCSTMEALYGQLGQHVLGRRLRIVEVQCAAMGAPHCKIAIYKDQAQGGRT